MIHIGGPADQTNINGEAFIISGWDYLQWSRVGALQNHPTVANFVVFFIEGHTIERAPCMAFNKKTLALRGLLLDGPAVREGKKLYSQPIQYQYFITR